MVNQISCRKGQENRVVKGNPCKESKNAGRGLQRRVSDLFRRHPRTHKKKEQNHPTIDKSEPSQVRLSTYVFVDLMTYASFFTTTFGTAREGAYGHQTAGPGGPKRAESTVYLWASRNLPDPTVNSKKMGQYRITKRNKVMKSNLIQLK